MHETLKQHSEAFKNMGIKLSPVKQDILEITSSEDSDQELYEKLENLQKQ